MRAITTLTTIFSPVSLRVVQLKAMARHPTVKLPEVFHFPNLGVIKRVWLIYYPCPPAMYGVTLSSVYFYFLPSHKTAKQAKSARNYNRRSLFNNSRQFVMLQPPQNFSLSLSLSAVGFGMSRIFQLTPFTFFLFPLPGSPCCMASVWTRPVMSVRLSVFLCDSVCLFEPLSVCLSVWGRERVEICLDCILCIQEWDSFTLQTRPK